MLHTFKEIKTFEHNIGDIYIFLVYVIMSILKYMAQEYSLTVFINQLLKKFMIYLMKGVILLLTISFL